MPLQLVGTPVFNRYTNPISASIPATASVAFLGYRWAASGVLSATYNSNAMTLVRQYPDNTTAWRNSLFRYNAALGSGSASVSRLADAAWGGDAVACVFFAEGVDTTTPVRDSAGDSAETTTATVTVTSQAGDLCVAVVSYGGGLGAATGADIWQQADEDGVQYVVLSKIATGTSTSLTATIPAGTEWHMVGASLIPASGSTNVSPTATTNLLTSTLGSSTVSIGGGTTTALRGAGALLRPGRPLGL